METSSTQVSNKHSKSELEKFKLFYEFDFTEKEIRAEIKRQAS